MDREPFDALTRLFAATPSRRAAIGALLGAGLAGATGSMEAKGKNRKRNRRQKQGQSALAAEAADCLNPGPSANMNGCNFNNEDLSGRNLSSSAMRGTRFRGANLCGADLSSSQLKDADLRGFAAPGRVTNLTRADLSSSGCQGTRFNNRTLFCQTKMCNGAVNDRDCLGGVDPEDVCCGDADCPPRHTCAGGVCVPDCLTADTCCGFDEAVCQARCCTGIAATGSSACGEQFICARTLPGGPCATDNDCGSPIGPVVCRADRCCSFEGGFCQTAEGCCTAGAACLLRRCSA